MSLDEPILSRQVASSLQEALAWFHFLPATGTAGKLWYQRYVESGSPELTGRLDLAVSLLQRRSLDEGLGLLGECRAEIDRLKVELEDGSIFALADSNYWVALAYYYYHVEGWEEGAQCLDRGIDSLENALAVSPFLLPCCGRCYDFCLHYARLARGQRRWDEMWGHLQRGREMVRSERPLCRPNDWSIYIDDVYHFYASIAPLSEAEEQALQLMADKALAIKAYENRAVGATVIPFLVLEGVGR